MIFLTDLIDASPVTSLYIYEMSSSELITRSFLAGDDFIIKTSPVFPDDVTPTAMNDFNATTESSSTDSESTEETLATTQTPRMMELSKNATTQDDESTITTSETTEKTSTVTIVTSTTEDEDTMTSLDRFVTSTEKPIETTLESDKETETTKQVKRQKVSKASGSNKSVSGSSDVGYRD